MGNKIVLFFQTYTVWLSFLKNHLQKRWIFINTHFNIKYKFENIKYTKNNKIYVFHIFYILKLLYSVYIYIYIYIYIYVWKWKSESDVTYGQVWWPILGICALHLTHPKCTQTAVNTHTPWTHTRSSGQPFMLRRPVSSCGFGALLKGTSVVVLRVERALDIHSPHLQFLPDLRLEPATFGLRVRLSNH